MGARLARLDTIERLNELFAESQTRPVVLFKHSNRCGISSHLFEEIRAVEGEVNVVVVQEAREVSDAIEQRTGYRHHSPQAFVIRGGKAVYHASHYAIDPGRINMELDEVAGK